MRINKLIMVQTGTYNDMVARPYQTNLDNEAMAQFHEATEGGMNVGVSAVSGIAGTILRPATQPESLINVPNGWNEPRLRFIMEVDHGTRMGCRQSQILTGYTDYVGVTPSGNVDQNMRLFFNNSISLREVGIDAPTGRQSQTTVTDSSHILTQGYDAASAWNGTATLTMRPQDLFSQMQTQMLDGGETTMDLRTTFSNGMKKSRRSNGSAPSYVSNVIRAYKAASDNVDYSSTPTEIYDSASSGIRDSMVSTDMFLSNLERISQFNTNGSVTYGELLAIDPSIDQRALITLQGKTHQATAHSAGMTEHWHGTTVETVAATVLSHSVPSIMMDLLITRLSFMATNEVMGGGYDVRILGADGFNKNLDLTPYLERFVNRIKLEVLRDITRNDQMSISIQMEVDVVGDTFVSISMNGQPAIDYVTPSFCDALMAPVITNNRMTLDSVAGDFETIFSSAIFDGADLSNSGSSGGSDILI